MKYYYETKSKYNIEEKYKIINGTMEEIQRYVKVEYLGGKTCKRIDETE